MISEITVELYQQHQPRPNSVKPNYYSAKSIKWTWIDLQNQELLRYVSVCRVMQNQPIWLLPGGFSFSSLVSSEIQEEKTLV